MTGVFYKAGTIIDYVASKAVGYGEVVQIGGIVGVTSHSADVGEAVACSVEGVYKFPKKASEKITAGTKVYMDANAVTATKGTSGVALGTVWADASADDAEVQVRINF